MKMNVVIDIFSKHAKYECEPFKTRFLGLVIYDMHIC